MTGDEKSIESVASLYYIRVVPSMWGYEIREKTTSYFQSLFYFTKCDKLTMAKLTSGHYKGTGILYSVTIYSGLLYPRVISSSPLLSINEDDIKNNLKNFLKSHDVFPVDIKLLLSNVILMITEYIYSSIRSRMNIFYYPDTVVDNLKMPWITIDAKWK
ncbi:hypothetical protein BD770DRAFT_445950 [Pilaira anomala]|nr:hypothetical protein BD770DRAFT_445950 [Pilaira anomala]